MKKNIIIGLVFVVCLYLVGYTGYYIGTKTAQTTIVEEVQETNIEELTNSIKAEVYNNAYEDGYNQGKIEVFQMMLEEEQNEEIIDTSEEVSTDNIVEQNNASTTSVNTQPNYEETQEVNSTVEETSSNHSGFNFLDCICYECNLQFNSRYELNEHCISVHGIDCGWSDPNHIDVQGYKCSMCSKIFYDINELQQHYYESHLDYGRDNW